MFKIKLFGAVGLYAVHGTLLPSLTQPADHDTKLRQILARYISHIRTIGLHQVVETKTERRDDWFNSVNSAAHITVVEFWGDVELASFIGLVRKFCKTAIPSEVCFDHFDSFGQQTFYIAPDIRSKKYLNTLLENLHAFLKVKFPAQAHMTIARKLDANKMKVAFELFQNTVLGFQFVCNAFHLRKFNEQKRQYSEIIETIPFEGKSHPNLFGFL